MKIERTGTASRLLCRFVNADPSGFGGGLNHYAYADGNPISLIGPFGLGASEAGWGSQLAGWLDRNATGPLNSVSSSSTLLNYYAYNAGSLVGGFADLFRLGEGTANATYHAQDGWDVAIGITSDVGRAAGIATIVGGGLEATVGRVGTAATPATTTRFVSTQNGIVDVQPTLNRIQSGGTFPHRNDGGIFQNRPLPGNTTPQLPAQSPGYYNEYVHPTPGVNGPGAQRIVVGQGGELYYTPDHYQTFVPLNPP